MLRQRTTGMGQQCLKPWDSTSDRNGSTAVHPSQAAGVCAMADGRLRQLFWRVVDHLDYLLTLARLRIPDAVVGPEPKTPADQQRARERIESPR